MVDWTSSIADATPAELAASYVLLRVPGSPDVPKEFWGIQLALRDTSGNLIQGCAAMPFNGATTGFGFGVSIVDATSTQNVTGASAAQSINKTSWTAGTTYFTGFLVNGAGVGSISSNGTSTSYNTTSDYRLKKNVKPVENAAARLMELKPVNFEWRSTGAKTDGFLAHEFDEVIPGGATGEKDATDGDGKPIYQGIDQSKAVPLLVAALQEALTRIAALEAALAA